MSDARAARLETSIKKRLLDVRRHLAALEHAAAGFGGDFELQAFEAAWRSDDPETLTRAYAVQAGYENVINACIRIAQELAELESWTARGSELSSIEALKLLQENGVIAARTRIALKEAQERRSDVQHDYVNVAGREIHAAALAVLENAPLLAQDVAGVLRERLSRR
jgi:ribonuclease HepT-like protein